MPSLRFLVLHGAGSSAEIMSTQLRPLQQQLEGENLAEFDYAEGTLETEAGPGLENFFEPPYYSFHAWPPTASDRDEKTIQDAFDELEEVLEEDGPYDGIIGFSHGGMLLSSFLADWSSRRPGEDLPCKCAVFVSSFPPFRMENGDLQKPVWRNEGLEYLKRLPTLHIMGKADFVYDHSQRLLGLCGEGDAIKIVHDKGHELPTDSSAVKEIVDGMRRLNQRVVCGF